MVTAPIRRLGALLLLSLFALFSGESVVLSSCPMHGDTAHQAHGAAEHEHKTPAAPEPCDCLGDCLGSVPVMAGFATAEPTGRVRVLSDTRPETRNEHVPARAQLKLADAQGPPVTGIA